MIVLFLALTLIAMVLLVVWFTQQRRAQAEFDREWQDRLRSQWNGFSDD